MKKRSILFLVLILVCIKATYASGIIEKLNDEIFEKYGKKNYIKNDSPYGVFNENIFDKYQIPVYGNPHGDITYVNGISVPRFIGYADTGESVPNPDYPPDSVTGEQRIDLPWIINPWDNINVYSHENFTKIQASKFDPYREDFRESFIASMLRIYGPSGTIRKGLFKKEDGYKKNWSELYHIIIPPTYHSKGMAIMFHDNGGTLWYQDIILEPYKALNGTLHIKTVTESGKLIEEKTVELLNDSTTTHTRPEYAQYEYLGLGYSTDKTITTPAMKTSALSQAVTYDFKTNDQDFYLTFYYREKPLEPTEHTITGQITLSDDIYDVSSAILMGEG